MSGLSLRIGLADRAPGPDEEEGERLVTMVRDGMQRGVRGALGVAIRPERTEWFDLGAVVRQQVPVDGFLAALSRSTAPGHPAPLAVGLAGRFERRRGSRVLSVAVVFVEWADDRWWHWERVLRESEPHASDDDDDELEQYARAIDGDPIPDGLGRWFVRGRRTKATLSFGELRRPVVDGSHLVH